MAEPGRTDQPYGILLDVGRGHHARIGTDNESGDGRDDLGSAGWRTWRLLVKLPSQSVTGGKITNEGHGWHSCKVYF
jgi:hypothetical protein